MRLEKTEINPHRRHAIQCQIVRIILNGYDSIVPEYTEYIMKEVMYWDRWFWTLHKRTIGHRIFWS